MLYANQEVKQNKVVLTIFFNAQEEPLEQVMSNGHDGEGAVGGGSAFYSYAILSAGFHTTHGDFMRKIVARHRAAA